MKDPVEAYARAMRQANRDGTFERAALEIAALFSLDIFHHAGGRRVAALINHVGLLPSKIALDGPWFELDSVVQFDQGWPAFVLPIGEFPVFGGEIESIVDLVAFVAEGRHAGRVMRYTGAVGHVGFDAPPSGLFDIFTQPRVWLEHWLARVAVDVDQGRPPAYGPEAAGALILDPRSVDWRPFKVEPGVVGACSELRFRDSPELRDQVAKEVRLPKLNLPRLRAAKPKPPSSES